MTRERPLLAALAGQPNCGKSTIFNMITGLHQEIANFPGVTVEQKTGSCRIDGTAVELVDLPGTYSLTSYSQEERVTRDFLLLESPDVVIAVVDASNLARHLYFVFQLMEMNLPLILCLNMTDVAARRGIVIDPLRLSERLEVPVISTVGARGRGGEELKRAILEVSGREKRTETGFRIDYGEEAERILNEFTAALHRKPHLMEDFSARWLAVKLLENDREAWRIVEKHTHDGRGSELVAILQERRHAYVEASRRSPEKTIAAARYARADRIEAECSTRPAQPGRTLTDRIDAVVCSRLFGLPCVALCIFLTFQLTFQLADGWQWIPWHDGWISPVGLFSWFFEEWLPALTTRMADGALKSLINEAVFAGVGGVMGFVPIIFFMFAFLAILEDSGYITRVAFVLDRALRAFGLQGQSVLPMIISGGIAGGCAVPGVLSTRTMRERKDRILTMLVAPFMSCGAKIPVYALLVAAFFSAHKGMMMWLLSLLAWGLALLAAKILSRTILQGEYTPFIMELPPYHLPRPGAVLQSAGQRSWMYMKKAGTVILAINILLWALMYFPRQEGAPFEAKRQLAGEVLKEQSRGSVFGSCFSTSKAMEETHRFMLMVAKAENEHAERVAESMAEDELRTRLYLGVKEGGTDAGLFAWRTYQEALETLSREESGTQLAGSFAGQAGRLLVPLSRLAGFDWRDNIALIGGFAAKEIVVSTLSTAYRMGAVDTGAVTAEGDSHPLARRLQADPTWTPLRAFSLMIFVMIYAPCFVTISVIWRESGSWRWAAFSTAYTTALAFLLSTLIFQIGSALS